MVTVRRQAAVGLVALALLLGACTAADVAENATPELPAHAVELALPAREELVAEVHEVVGEAEEASVATRVVDALHGEIAIEHARRLDDAFPARVPFTTGERDAAHWIVDSLHAMGLPEEHVHVQAFGTKSLDGHARAELTALRETAGGERLELSQNVVARLPGTGEGVIVVGAHYDSTGPGLPTVNGAAVGLLLETAWRLQGQELPHTVELVFFGAEHAGFAGAQAYLASLSQEQRDDVVLVVSASGLTAADELGVDVGSLEEETGRQVRDDLSTAILEQALGLDAGLRPFHHGIFSAGATLPFTYAGLRVVHLAAITERIVERPSLADGGFSPGRVREVEPAVADAAPTDDGLHVTWTVEDDDPTFELTLVPGRAARALYVYGTFLETLLLTLPL